MDFKQKASRKQQIIILSLFLCVGFFLRIHRIGVTSLWFDEACSVLNGRYLLSVIYKCGILPDRYPSFLSDIPIFLWYKCFGSDELVLRLFSVMFGLFTICLVYTLTKMIFNKKIAVIATFLTTISPIQVYYSQELRTYSMITFLSLTAVFFLYKALEGGKMKFWAGYAFFNILNIYLHYMTFFILLAQVMFVLIFFKEYKNEKRIKKWISANILILISIVPWVINNIFLLKMIFESKKYLWIPSWEKSIGLKNLFFTFKNFIVGYHVTKDIYIPVTAISLGLLLFGMFKAREKIKSFLLCSCCLFIPLISMFLISQFIVWYVDRYVIYSSIFFYILIAYGLSRLKKMYMFICLLALSCGFMLALSNYYKKLPVDYNTCTGVVDKHDYGKACSYLSNNLRKDDIIFHTSYSSTAPFDYYFEKNNVNKIFLTELPVILFFSKDEDRFQAKEFNFKGCKYKDVAYEKLIDGKKRIWLILSDWIFDSKSHLEKETSETALWMCRNYKEIEKKMFKGIVLYLFEKT